MFESRQQDRPNQLAHKRRGGAQYGTRAICRGVYQLRELFSCASWTAGRQLTYVVVHLVPNNRHHLSVSLNWLRVPLLSGSLLLLFVSNRHFYSFLVRVDTQLNPVLATWLGQKCAKNFWASIQQSCPKEVKPINILDTWNTIYLNSFAVFGALKIRIKLQQFSGCPVALCSHTQWQLSHTRPLAFEYQPLNRISVSNDGKY